MQVVALAPIPTDRSHAAGHVAATPEPGTTLARALATSLAPAGTATGTLAQATAAHGQGLGAAELAEVLFAALEDKVAGERVLVLVPDRTRNVPLAEVFPIVAQALHRAGAVDVMVALGTHAPLPEEDILDMIGVEGGPRSPVTSVGNHQWSTSSALSRIGTVSAERLREIAGTTWHRSLGGDLPVRVNKRALQVDRVVIVGPTLPHEVAGFSGGAKYLFPGISGPEMIDVMHWLGALSGVLATIGYPDTAVRRAHRRGGRPAAHTGQPGGAGHRNLRRRGPPRRGIRR